MELWVLDTNFKMIDVLDTFKSLIWTTRYSDCGDFEMYLAMNVNLLLALKQDYYIWLADSEEHMIIEDFQIETGLEDGNYLSITGRSLESILTRRIIWKQTLLTGNLQNGIQRLLTENVISPTDSRRKIPNFIFKPSTDPRITSLTVNAQFTGDELYKAIRELCDNNKIAFKITLSEDNKFVFELYAGVDRSYRQLTNPYVVFSPEFENLVSSSYLESKKPLKTVTLVAGEGEGADRRTTTVEIDGGGSGLDRREIFTDAREVSSKTDDGEMVESLYLQQLAEKGLIKLDENNAQKVFEGEVDFSQMFRYGEHFGMGDIVQVRNEYGLESRSRVTELIRSQDESGVNVYPTFVVDDGN